MWFFFISTAVSFKTNRLSQSLQIVLGTNEDYESTATGIAISVIYQIWGYSVNGLGIHDFCLNCTLGDKFPQWIFQDKAVKDIWSECWRYKFSFINMWNRKGSITFHKKNRKHSQHAQWAAQSSKLIVLMTKHVKTFGFGCRSASNILTYTNMRYTCVRKFYTVNVCLLL